MVGGTVPSAGGRVAGGRAVGGKVPSTGARVVGGVPSTGARVVGGVPSTGGSEDTLGAGGNDEPSTEGL